MVKTTPTILHISEGKCKVSNFIKGGVLSPLVVDYDSCSDASE